MNQIVQPTFAAPVHRVALVEARWHRDVVHRCRDAFLDRLEGLGVPASLIDVIEVPGVFEIPLQVQVLAKSGQYAAIAATGLIVDGGVYRHEFVSTAVIDGLMRVQLDTGVPVLTAVLTPIRYHEHEEHRSFFREHFLVKGRELADACRAVLDLYAPVPA